MAAKASRIGSNFASQGGLRSAVCFSNRLFCSQTKGISQTDEIFALLRLDNRALHVTESKSAGERCWDQQFSLNLERSKELEIEVYYCDTRSMCAFVVLRLGDCLDAGTRKKQLELEPQGQLHIEVANKQATASPKTLAHNI